MTPPRTLPRTIAIDGPAAAGKTTVADAIAQALGYLLVDTGAFYRAVTLAALREHVPITDGDALAELARRVDLDITPDRSDDGRLYTVLLNGDDVTAALRSAEVEAAVSPVSAAPGVREALNAKYRRLALATPRVIMVGRDIGTVVLPDADLKIFLDASLDVRADRRLEERLANGSAADREALRAAMARRDRIDSERKVAPMAAAPDAHHINTDKLDRPAVIKAVMTLVEGWRGEI
ncbi:MAG: (d)CMP kinase [Anaerolineae bacterium]|nr:(d)CMP kinase [Anaerolineae bacterium]